DMGCANRPDPLGCLRAASAQALTEKTALGGEHLGGIYFIDKNTTYFFEPTIDGQVLPDQLEKAFSAGDFNRVPVLHGANSDEGGLFLDPFPFYGKSVDTQADFAALVEARYPGRGKEITALYGPPRNPTWNDAMAELIGDAVFLCPSRRLASYLHASGQTNYLYRFAGTLDALLLPRVSGKSFHGADTPYVLGNDFPLGTIPSGQEGLTQTMQSHWARFALSGDPNAMGQTGPTWTAYEPDARDEIVLKVPVERGTYAHAEECELWKRVAAEELTHAAAP
ncbi:MAG: hypothetical protein RL385_2058, partial [Pseudomonadota bacterium]